MDGILKVAPEQLISTATEFSNCGTTVRNITTAMTDIVVGLSAAWSGEDASAYIAKFNGLQDDINKMHGMIQEHVNDLNEMARLYSNATTSNISEIESLSSDVII